MAVDDSYTKALLHMDGADASTAFTDESGKVWTAAGNAQIDTAQSKFGGASGLFDGTGDYVDTPDNAGFDVGSGDFTVDCWFRKNANNVVMAAYGQADSGGGGASNSLSLYVNGDGASNHPACYLFYGAANKAITSSVAVTNDLWHHLAQVRYGNTMTLYLDGTSVGTVDVTGITANNSASKPAIGRPGEYAGEYMNGWIDEFRFSKGIARWTANFTPPIVPYPSMPTGPSAVFISDYGVM